jgi:hypothetical protein
VFFSVRIWDDDASVTAALALFGIDHPPWHAIFHCVLQSLDGDALAKTLGDFARGARRSENIAIDGKTAQFVMQ